MDFIKIASVGDIPKNKTIGVDVSIATFEDRGTEKLRASYMDYERGIGFGTMKPFNKRR